MIHFLYLTGFAFFVAAAFGIFSSGNIREKILYAAKIFAQFLIISIVLAWVFYYIPGSL